MERETRVNQREISGGEGIRTLGTVSRTAVFKTAAFDHSATPPTSRTLERHEDAASVASPRLTRSAHDRASRRTPRGPFNRRLRERLSPFCAYHPTAMPSLPPVPVPLRRPLPVSVAVAVALAVSALFFTPSAHAQLTPSPGRNCPRREPADGSHCTPPEGRDCTYPRTFCRCVREGPHIGLVWECSDRFGYRPPRPGRPRPRPVHRPIIRHPIR